MRKRGKPRSTGPNLNMVVPLATPKPIIVCGVVARDSIHAQELYRAQYDATQAGYWYGKAHREADEKDRLARLQAHLDGGGTHYTWLAKLHKF